MSATSPISPQADAGWYPDPQGRVGLRYWDGSTWTDHLAPHPAPVAPGVSTGTWVGGLALSFLLPIGGLILGIVFLTQGPRQRDAGLAFIGLSVACWILWCGVLALANA